MGAIHFIIQGKGGVGKSVTASLLYQTAKELGFAVRGFDTDPVNHTFAGFKEFDVQALEIMDGDNIDQRKFDTLMEQLLELGDDEHAVVDNGASSFVAFTSYLNSNEAVQVLQEAGHEVYFHCVVTGGQAILDTIQGLKFLCLKITDAPIVVWLNPFFGQIAMDGKSFEDFKVFKDHKEQFAAVIMIPQGNASTTGKDVEELYAKRQSFSAAVDSSLPVMVRSRLKKYWRDLVAIISQAPFFQKSA